MGDTILGNRYEIIQKIGDGGMAFVYEAKDKLLNRTVAVKVLRPEFVDDEEFLTKFKREAEAVASLSHPNIVNVYDVGEDGKVNYIVMELVKGQNLKEIIQNEGTLDEYTALDITKQIARALSAAHKKGIIHRDIKPHNILISNEGRVVKVADFGIAKATSNSTMTNIGSIIGSVHYFSPEQAKGKFVSNNADLYSLGIVLYEMLIGKVPFKGDSPISIALQHINDEIEFTSEEKVNIPQSVRTIIKKLTEKSPSNRYQSAEELIEDIEYIEKNIDLDFIKEYDNYATKKINQSEVNKSIPLMLEEDEDDTDELIEEEVPKVRKNKRKKDKQVKEDSPRTKLILKIAAVILVLILCTQLILAFKFFNGVSDKEDIITAPNLANMSLDDANKALDELGLKVSVTEEYDSTIQEDHVISQTPVAGTEVEKGDTINIILSKGAKKIEIPNIVGFKLEEAENMLKDNGLELGNIKYEFNSVYSSGTVLSQSPTFGLESFEEGQKVDVIVSKGAETIIEESEEEIEEEPEEEILQPQDINNGNKNNTGNKDKSEGIDEQTSEGDDKNPSKNSEQPSGSEDNTGDQQPADTSGQGEAEGENQQPLD